MRLVALLSARAPVSGAPPSAFTDDILIGLHTPVEHQARQLIAAGVEQILVRSDLPPPELSRTVDRLSRESGVPVTIATDGPELARRIEKDDHVLLLAGQMIVPQPALEALIDASVPALLVTPTEDATAHFERIDGQHVWAGGALLSGETLLGTIDMLGEWDLELTLLRRAVQLGAQRIELAPALAQVGRLARIGDQGDAERAFDAIAQSGLADEAPRDALSALLAPAARPLVSLMARHQVDPHQVNWGAGILSVLGVAAATADWPRLGMIFALLAEAGLGLSGACARVMLRKGVPLWLRVLVKGAGLAVLAVAGGRLAQGNILALAGVVLPLALIALETIADERDRRPISGRFDLWKQVSTGMALTIVLGGALGGLTAQALAFLGLCAIGTVAVRLLAGGENRI